jgi:hypothetical protein
LVSASEQAIQLDPSNPHIWNQVLLLFLWFLSFLFYSSFQMDDSLLNRGRMLFSLSLSLSLSLSCFVLCCLWFVNRLDSFSYNKDTFPKHNNFSKQQ